MERWGQALSDPTLWVVVAAVSIAMFVVSLLAMPRAVARLPRDYFVAKSARAADGQAAKQQRSVLAVAARNVIGSVLLLMGVAMLVLPGQGVLTVLVGLALVDFPGKHRLERRLARQRHVRRSLQWMRRRAKRPALLFDDDTDTPQSEEPS